MSIKLTLEQCGRKSSMHKFAAGSYYIDYTDSTHLQPDEWIRLAEIEVRSARVPLEDSQSDQFFTVRKLIGDLPGKPVAGGNPRAGSDKGDPAADYARRIRVIEDTLSLAIGRVGLIAPEVSAELLEDLLRLDEQDGVVIVPDTNALHNGAVHWLLRILQRPAVWLMPVVASLTTIQTRDATVKGLVNKGKISNLGQALRSRGLVNGSLGLFERNKGRCQVVEIDPSLLRYQKLASSTGADPDQSDVLEDRLIIEAIHGVLRSMRSRTARRVVTSDVNIARVLAAEGVETLFVPTISMPDTPVACLRFDALARGFIGAPLRVVLWELAHAFGSVRLRQGEEECVRLDCYWPNKTPSDWRSEALQCHFSNEVFASESPQPIQDHGANDGSNCPVEAELNGDNGSVPGPIVDNSKPDPMVPASSKSKVAPRLPVPIVSNLPRASLPQMFRLLGVAKRLGGGTAELLAGELRADPISPEMARRPLEILRRTGLVVQNADRYVPQPDADVADLALGNGDLDALSALFERFEPYKAFRLALQESTRVRRDEVGSLVKSLIGPAGTAEAERLPRYHVLLGQAWTDGDWIVDGSCRPTDRDSTDSFEDAFRQTESVGIAKVQDILLKYCESTKMSPWAAKRQIESFVASKMLPGFSFQPAAGGKPVTKDEIIVGSLDDLRTEPVIVDRIFLGEQPIFTIERASR